MKEFVYNEIQKHIINGDYTLYQFQQDILDPVSIWSSVSFGENDIEEYMEIGYEGDEDFYLKIDTKGNILESYN